MSEIMLPFGVNKDGQIATTDDPMTVGRQHLTTYLLTSPGERVMRPTFGTPIQAAVFTNYGRDSVSQQLLVTRISNAVSNDVSGLKLTALSVSDGDQPGTLLVESQFALTLGSGEGAVGAATAVAGGAVTGITVAPPVLVSPDTVYL